MKTFSKFLESKENSGEDESPELLLKAFEKACINNFSEVKAFLERLAKHDPDVQIELDKLNHSQGNLSRPRVQSNSAGPEGKGDVVIPSSADSYDSELA